MRDSADGEEDLDAATAEERFARAREEMRTRDEADRAAYAERRRERARLKKERARARAAAEGSGGPAVAATLGAPSDKNGDGESASVHGQTKHCTESLLVYQVMSGYIAGGTDLVLATSLLLSSSKWECALLQHATIVIIDTKAIFCRRRFQR